MKIIENNECLIEFGKFIKRGREQKNLYQTEVAEQLGVTQAYYSRIESGQRNVDLVMAMKICSILGLKINDYIREYME
jgi:transcriptional regulator with XRE-family HTH domain